MGLVFNVMLGVPPVVTTVSVLLNVNLMVMAPDWYVWPAVIVVVTLVMEVVASVNDVFATSP